MDSFGCPCLTGDQGRQLHKSINSVCICTLHRHSTFHGPRAMLPFVRIKHHVLHRKIYNYYKLCWAPAGPQLSGVADSMRRAGVGHTAHATRVRFIRKDVERLLCSNHVATPHTRPSPYTKRVKAPTLNWRGDLVSKSHGGQKVAGPRPESPCLHTSR